MAAAGILREDDPVELLEGEVVEMAPIGPPHGGCVKRLLHLLQSRVGDRAVISVQDPIRLGMYSEPQPDVALLRPRADFYSSRHPEADDVLLAIEVSASTVAFDRLVKVPLYAGAGIPQAWLVDLEAGVIEVYRLLSDAGYGEPERVSASGRVAIDAFPDVVVTASEILG